MIAVAISGCGRQIPPPKAPAEEPAELPASPSEPRAEGNARLFVDTLGEQAAVARVVEKTTIDPKDWAVRTGPSGRREQVFPETFVSKTELLCVTPCATELPRGAHELVFTSTRDPFRTSTALVSVEPGTTSVRHRLGYDKPFTRSYMLGAFLTILGGGMAVVGSLGFVVSAGADGETSKNGEVFDGKPMMIATGAITTVGLGMLVSGILLLVTNQPLKQEGATTVFRR